MAKIKVRSWCCPAVFTFHGKQYLSPVYDKNNKPIQVELPTGMTLADVEWEQMYPTGKSFKLEVVKVELVKGSKPGVVYKVKTWNTGKKECDCPGYTYRRQCKHTA